MSLEADLWAALSADSTIRGYVSSGSPLEHRIYPLRVPEEAPAPFIAYYLIDTDAYNKIGSAPGSERKRFEIGAVSRSYDEAKAIIEAVKRCLEGFSGYQLGSGDEYYKATQEYRVWLEWSLIG